MRAIIQERYGAPQQVLRLQEIDRPVVGDHDVLIRVRATSVNTPDWVAVTGSPRVLRLQTGIRGPRTPVRGSDVAGVVEAIGKDVTAFAPGDEVFGAAEANGSGKPGTFAEYALARPTTLIRKPAGLSFNEAAAVGMSGVTALTAIRDVGAVGPQTRVLINGASGGVGTFAVQIAKALGAEVTGVCGPTNVELVRSLGADHVVDYTVEDFTRSPQRYDVILDNVLNHPPGATARALAPGGLLIPNSVGNTGGLFAGVPRMGRAMLMGLNPLRRGSKRVRLATASVDRESLEALAALIAAGEVRVVIDTVYPLPEAASAIAHMLGHHASGNIVIAVP